MIKMGTNYLIQTFTIGIVNINEFHCCLDVVRRFVNLRRQKICDLFVLQKICSSAYLLLLYVLPASFQCTRRVSSIRQALFLI
uniref:Uncharacterized protein n=1 Tax=Pararge aegeria TaxID=116150 RepID=S4PRB2_9NEOP